MTFVEEAFLEKEDGDDPDRDGGIGKVEDGTKEFKVFSTDKRQP